MVKNISNNNLLHCLIFQIILIIIRCDNYTPLVSLRKKMKFENICFVIFYFPINLNIHIIRVAVFLCNYDMNYINNMTCITFCPSQVWPIIWVAGHFLCYSDLGRKFSYKVITFVDIKKAKCNRAQKEKTFGAIFINICSVMCKHCYG